ncbi:UDP-N-acetylglucosamine--peptide N-acetylglucosaminyltransferase 110 kDa subunit-like [Melanaphis sacchari]|nr:UDP-N-acetylglucosamine--peptide N-acetylglucosaminyltransferase 110 kDa subunit-like [Melanaphis sacchari]
MFCPDHVKCESPISVITNILSESNPKKFEDISKKFKLLGITKVKDLARATFGMAYSINLGDETIKTLYKALEVHYNYLADLQISAKLELQNGNFIKTRQICEELLRHLPNDLNIITLMAESFFKCGNYEKSFSFLRLAININPNSFEVLNNIASNYWKQSQYDLAKNYLSEAIFKKPSYINGWINYAEALFKTNDAKSAEYIYIPILNLKPDLYTVRNKYGKFLLSLNRLKNAKQQFKIALKSAPEFQETLCNLGDVYFKTDKFDKAILNYHKALEVNSNLKNTLVNLGLAYLKVTEYSKAVNSFEKAIELDPDNISALRYLAVTYCYQDNMLLSVETYKKCLKLQPDNLDITLELALVYFHNLENFEEAENYFEKCIELNSQREDLYKYLFAVYQKLNKYKNASDISISLGDLYLDRSDLENARNAFITAAYFNPENVYGHWKVGLIMHLLGHFNLALIRYRKAIELNPNFAHVYCDSAIIYEKFDKNEMALDYYKMTLLLQPGHLNALLNMLFLKQKLGQYDDIEVFNTVLRIDEPDAFQIHLDFANFLYKEFRNLDVAILHYEKALTYDNTSVEIYLCLGNICIKLNNSKDALRHFYMAIQLDSLCLEAYINIGSIQKDNNNFVDAIHAYETILKLKPDFPEVFCNLVLCLQKVCDWSNYDSHMVKLKEIVNRQLDDDKVLTLLPHDSLLFPLSFEVQKKIGIKYVQQCVEELEKSIEGPQQFFYPTSLNKKLRFGFILTNFYKHPISTILEYLIQKYSSKVQLFFYSVSSNDNNQSWMKNDISFKKLSHLNVIDAAKVINSDEIHVLVDMGGYTKNSIIKIFALRPAKVQVSWYGYPCISSNVAFIDYFFAHYSLLYDKKLANEIKEFNDKIIFLNSTIFIGDHKEKFPNLLQRNVMENTNNILDQNSLHLDGNQMETSEIPDFISFNKAYIEEQPSKEYVRVFYNLPDNVVVFCNFNKLYKIDPLSFRTWLTILNNVPHSVLWLLSLNDAAENNLRKFASDLNFDSSRIIFADLIPKYQHLNRIQLADIYLDSFLYNGHMACLDALWAGIPVITFPGKKLVTLVTNSQLFSLGMKNLFAHNEKQYIEIAIQLAMNKQLLENAKKGIWNLKTNSKLFKIDGFVNQVMAFLIKTQTSKIIRM